MHKINLTSLSDCYTLSNQVHIPCIALGTWQSSPELTADAVQKAVEGGYRHLDCAAVYGNEKDVGRGIAQAGLPRKELFLTSKVWNIDRGYEKTLKAFEASCLDLGTDYLDLYMIHWPANRKMYPNDWQKRNLDTWRALEKLYHDGRVRAIGFSNFMPHHLESLLHEAQITPMVCQQELHIGMLRPETVRFCREYGMVIEAYSPMGSGALQRNPILQCIAQRYQVSVAQLCIRWCLQNGFLPLPKSVTQQRIEQNADVFHFEISAEDMRLLNAMPYIGGLNIDPDELDV